MYRWLITLLRILFPLDPVAQLREVTRYFIGTIIDSFNDPDWAEQLDTLPEARAILEARIASAEEGLQLLIHERACQILGHQYRYTNRPLEYPRRRARPMPEVLARLERALALQDRVEELAQRRAARMKRDAAANPLGLVDPMMIREHHDDRAIITQRITHCGVVLPSAAAESAQPRGPPLHPRSEINRS